MRFLETLFDALAFWRQPKEEDRPGPDTHNGREILIALFWIFGSIIGFVLFEFLGIFLMPF